VSLWQAPGLPKMPPHLLQPAVITASPNSIRIVAVRVILCSVLRSLYTPPGRKPDDLPFIFRCVFFSLLPEQPS
jgi:hypothetical protein